MEKVFKLISNALFVALLAIMFIVGISLLPLPKNFKIYSVSTGSMTPTFKVGTLIIVKPLDSYKINDIVTMKTSEPRKTLTHRIVGKITKDKQIFFETKGDANKSKDMQYLLPQNIIGKVFFAIPYLGYPVSYSKTLPGLIFIIIIPATIIIYSELMNIKNEAIRLIKERKTRKLTAFEKVEEKVGEEIIEAEKEIEKDIKKVFKNKKKKKKS